MWQKKNKYKTRKARIRAMQSYDDREVFVNEEIHQLNEEILDLKNKINQLEDQKKTKEEMINQIQLQKKDFGLELYKDYELRKKIIDEIETTTFSKNKIEITKENYLEDGQWNQDTVTLETIEIFFAMECHLNETNNIDKNIVINAIENLGIKVIESIEKENVKEERRDDT